MNDSVLVEALRARDPGALAALYDSHADSVYRYAWAVLESPDSAQVALRDTLIAAEAHVHALADPERLRVWLYALARGECVRRRSVVPSAGGEETASGGQAVPEAPDGDLRLVAVNAVGALPRDEREILDLLTRHAIPEHELSTVLGITAAEADRLRQDACGRLQALVTTEILARNAAHDCPGRAEIISGFTGDLDEETRERLLQHLEHCTACAPHLERQVSAAKVFNLLPQPLLPETLRVRVMSCFIDPELVPYRRFVARRTGLLNSDGFPVRGTKGDRRWPQGLAGAVAAVAMVLGAIVLYSALRAADDPLPRSGYGALPAPPASPAGGTPAGADPTRHPAALTPVAGGTPSVPAASPGSVVPPIAVIRLGTGVPIPPALVATPSPSRSTHAGTPRPAPSSSPLPTPPPAPPTDSPTVVPPTPPATPTEPPGEPSGEPTPTASHQHDPAPTPCPSKPRRTPPATPSPSRAGDPSSTLAPSHGHARHASGGYLPRPRREWGHRSRWLGRPGEFHHVE
jgi:DNA-directed RNA polymerase specialized sigma24 family protein